MVSIKKLLAVMAGVACVVGLLYGVDALSTAAAQYFNDCTAIQFLNWLYHV